MAKRSAKPTVFSPAVNNNSGATAVTSAGRQSRKPTKVEAAVVESPDQAVPFRPTVRPPMAVVEVMDDGKSSGEVFRIRQDSITIGREAGDIVIPHDRGITREHVRISRREVNGSYEWYLSDLESTNGTFMKVRKLILTPKLLFTIGSFSYSYKPAGASIAPADHAPQDGTMRVSAVNPADLARMTARLVRTNGTEPAEFPLPVGENTVGSDPSRCTVIIADDPAVSSVHALISAEPDGRMSITDRDSLNGLWKGVDRDVCLGKGNIFQIGEQRIKFRAL